MRYFKISAFLSLCVLFVVGCGGSNNSGGPVPPPANQFAGNYQGSTTYQDPNRGSVTIPLQLRVADDGSVQIAVMSLGGTGNATGSVDGNGVLTASYTNAPTTRITGRFTREGNATVVQGNISTAATGSLPASSSRFAAKRE